MNAEVRKALDTVLSRSPAQPVFRWRASRRLAVLAYHGVEDPERFERHVRYIRRWTHPVSVEDVLAATLGRRGLPPRAILITFDDGHRSVLEVALPMLQEYGIPAVAFVIAGLIDAANPPWWTVVKEQVAAGGNVQGLSGLTPEDLVRVLKRLPDNARLAAIDQLHRTAGRSASPCPQLTRDDLRRLQSAGISIGNHTLTHPSLSRCDEAKIRYEIRTAHELLTSALGSEPYAFAYPYGDRDRRARAELAAIGYRVAFLFDHRISFRIPLDPLAISRLRVDSDSEFDRFRIIVSGLHPALHHARGRS